MLVTQAKQTDEEDKEEAARTHVLLYMYSAHRMADGEVQ